MKNLIFMFALERCKFFYSWLKKNYIFVMASAKTGEQGATHTIVITLDKENLPKGPFKKKINIHTKHGEKAEVVDVTLEGKVL